MLKNIIFNNKKRYERGKERIKGRGVQIGEEEGELDFTRVNEVQEGRRDDWELESRVRLFHKLNSKKN